MQSCSGGYLVWQVINEDQKQQWSKDRSLRDSAYDSCFFFWRWSLNDDLLYPVSQKQWDPAVSVVTYPVMIYNVASWGVTGVGHGQMLLRCLKWPCLSGSPCLVPMIVRGLGWLAAFQSSSSFQSHVDNLNIWWMSRGFITFWLWHAPSACMILMSEGLDGSLRLRSAGLFWRLLRCLPVSKFLELFLYLYVW